jgi:hypothetical protein
VSHESDVDFGLCHFWVPRRKIRQLVGEGDY